MIAPQDGTVDGKDLWIWFGDNDHSAWRPLFEKYILPDFIPASADTALSFGVAGPNSGVPWHTHGPGYSETVIGRKRWMLYPPGVRPDFDPERTTFQWMREGYPKIPTDRRPWECVVRANEALWFPPDWWHATLNLDESVFISTFVNYKDRLNAGTPFFLRGQLTDKGHKLGVDYPWL
mmetsp:Transcript_49591/g.158426  ORF Transcript_49591/g.158426 Transcript_49591/m.158426 type:complete len:178 (+) Transcript_49591:308-841(+)